jgi:hypothetical protein
MSKVKYPDKKEIDIQISMILDKSELFKENNSKPTFLECEKTRQPVNIKRHMISLCAIAAAAALIIVSINLIKPIFGVKSVTPLTNNIEDDIMNSTSIVKVNDSITFSTKQQVKSTRINNDQEGQSTYALPIVTYNGQIVKSISEYYQDKMNLIQTKLDAMYLSVKLGGNDTKSTLVQSDPNPMVASFQCSVVSGVSERNKNVVSILENYNETTKYEDVIQNNNTVSGSSFDIRTGNQIKLKDILTDYNAGRQQIMILLKQQVVNQHGVEAMVDKLDADAVLEDGQWYFGANGLTICCNGLVNNTGKLDDKIYNNAFGETYVIPYEYINYIKNDYLN